MRARAAGVDQAQRFAGGERRVEVDEPGEEMHGLADDRFGNRAAQSRAVDAIGQIEMRAGRRTLGIVEKSRRQRRLRALAIVAALRFGDGSDILAVLKHRQLRDAVGAGGIDGADRQRDRAGAQRLDVVEPLRRRLDIRGGVFLEPAFNQQFRNFLRDRRTQHGFLQLRTAVFAALDGVELLRVRAGHRRRLHVLRRGVAAVVVVADVGRGAGSLRGIHREFGVQRIGLLAVVGEFSEIAAGGGRQRFAGVERFEFQTLAVAGQRQRNGEGDRAWRVGGGAAHERGIARQIDDG